MSSQTHYDLLAVSADADLDTIRASYRRLSRSYHPDVAGDAGTLMMQKLNEAWDTLRDTDRRAAYDYGLRSEQAPTAPEPETAPADPTFGTATADEDGDMYADSAYRFLYITEKDGRLVYDVKVHRVWNIIRWSALALLAAATIFYIASIQGLTGDLAGQAPLRAFAVPSLLIFGLMTFGTHGTSVWNFPFRAAFVLFCLTGPLAATQLMPFTFIAPNFHWWESATAVSILVITLVHKRAKKIVLRYVATRTALT